MYSPAPKASLWRRHPTHPAALGPGWQIVPLHRASLPRLPAPSVPTSGTHATVQSPIGAKLCAIVQALKIFEGRGKPAETTLFSRTRRRRSGGSGRTSESLGNDMPLRRLRGPENYSVTEPHPDGRPCIGEMRQPLRLGAEEHPLRGGPGPRVRGFRRGQDERHGEVYQERRYRPPGGK